MSPVEKTYAIKGSPDYQRSDWDKNRKRSKAKKLSAVPIVRTTAAKDFAFVLTITTHGPVCPHPAAACEGPDF